MMPKALQKSCLITLFAMSCTLAIAGSPNSSINETMPAVHVSFDECQSFIGGSNTDYSEFTGVQIVNPACSITPGVANTLGMCVTANDNCFYDAGNPQSLKFNINVIPAEDGLGSIEFVSFYEQSPDTFNFDQGATGLNNYPTKYALRVLTNGQEIYREVDIETSRNWNFVEFDLRGVFGFTVAERTVFNFEILPYCPVGNGAAIKAFDIDELVVSGGCNNINGGILTTNDPTEVCTGDPLTGVVNFDVSDMLGSNFAWALTDDTGEIVQIPSVGAVDFRNLPNGIYNVYHIAHEDQFEGFLVGNNLNDLVGCFDISNAVTITNSKVVGGRLVDAEGFMDFYICSQDPDDNQVDLVLNDSEGFFTNYFLTDQAGNINQVLTEPSVDFSSFDDGIYILVAATHNGQLVNGIVGQNISNLEGCYDLSSTFTVRKQFVDGGSISLNGLTVLDLCGSESMSLSPESFGAQGNNLFWVISNMDGTILTITNTLPINLSNLEDENLELRLISYVGRIDNFDLGDDINTLAGCFDLSNPILIMNEAVLGGSIAVDDETNLFLCLSNAGDQEFTVDLSGAQGPNSLWLVTDTDNVILETSDSNSFDLSNAGSGTCLVWHISYNDGLTGIEAGANVSDFDGCYGISNPVTVVRDVVSLVMVRRICFP